MPVSPKQLARLIHKKHKASNISLAGVPLVEGNETKHTLLLGTTGVGKSTAFNHLITQIQQLGQKAVIVDTTGDFVNRYYNPERDILLNPLDLRTHHWDLWKECIDDIQIDEIVASLLPAKGTDPFWIEASRTLLGETIRKLMADEDFSLKKLINYSVRLPLHQIQEFYGDSMATSLISQSADKMALSVRVTLLNHIKALSLLQETSKDGFSIREWIRDDQQSGFLFLAAMPWQRETLRPLLTTWINISINSLMSCVPDHQRRVWFILDEKPSLNKVEALPKALAEIRKYGGCIVAGLQSVSQLDDLYGSSLSRSMSSLYNTKIFFRAPEINAAQWASKTLGENEIREHAQSISFGAHQMRDGVSLNEQNKINPLVRPDELLNLPDLMAYLKLSGGLPVTKVEFQYVENPNVAESFVPNLALKKLKTEKPAEEMERTPDEEIKEVAEDLEEKIEMLLGETLEEEQFEFPSIAQRVGKK